MEHAVAEPEVGFGRFGSAAMARFAVAMAVSKRRGRRQCRAEGLDLGQSRQRQGVVRIQRDSPLHSAPRLFDPPLSNPSRQSRRPRTRHR